MKIKTQRRKVGTFLDYHEGMSVNQCKIVLDFFNLDWEVFDKWMFGQTGPIIERYDKDGNRKQQFGIYEYDLLRYINSKLSGTPLIFD